MLLNNDILSAIKSRQEGKDTLSWIERFGLHLFEEDCNPHVSFNSGERNEVLILRVCVNKEKKDGIISAYNCFFEIDENGFVRFCVNDAYDIDAKNLIELMDRAKWENQSTRNWWDEVFRHGNRHGKMDEIDEDTLKRESTQTSEYEKMNLMKFIESIQEEIGKAVSKLSIENARISNVFLVEQYAMALPVKYALSRMFPSAIGRVFGFIWKYWEEEEKLWTQNATRFHVPEELLKITLNTSPKMTVGDVVKMGEHGAIFTLSLTKDESGNCFLPTTPIFANSELKWNEITKGDVNADYSVGNMSFKRVRLSIYADGLQEIYVKNGLDVVASSVCENGKYQIKSLFLKKEKGTQKPMAPKSIQIQNWDTNEEKITTAKPIKPDSSVSQVISTAHAQDGDALISSHSDDALVEKKMKEIKHIIDDALEDTTIFLTQVAKHFFEEKYPMESWEKKYGESIPASYKEMKGNWNDSHQVEFSNFALFLSHYRSEILGRKDNPGVKWWREYNHVVSAVDQLKPIRNTKQHGYSKVVGIGFRNLSSCLTAMENLAAVLNNISLKDKIVDYFEELQSNYDDSVKEKWKGCEELQSVYRKFEERKISNK